MAETAEQYVKRIQATLGDKDPLSILQATPAKLSALVAGQTEAQLNQRPAPAKWSVAEIMAHLAETEVVFAFRVRLILGSNGTPIMGFDQDEWAKRYTNFPVSQSLDLQRAVRQANVALYKSLSPQQWEQFGMHSERGREDLRHIVRLHAGHDLNHVKQIENILGANEKENAA
jgi:DinB superfamily